MKKLQILAAIAALVSMNSSALNTITLGDSVRIHPVHLDGYSQHPVVMYNDGFCDSWTMGVAYPEGLMVKLVAGISPLDGMSIPYHDRYGNKQTARLLGISPNTLRSYVKQGKIKCGYRRTNGYPFYTGRAIRSCWAAQW